MKFEIQRKAKLVPTWWTVYDIAETLLEAMQLLIKHSENQPFEDFRIKSPNGEYHYEIPECIIRRREEKKNESRKKEALDKFLHGDTK